MSLVKNSAIYLLSNILNSAIPFLLLPVLTRYLTPSEYGQIAMFQSLVGGIAAFVGLNAVGAANRYYYEKYNTDENIGIFNGSCIQVLIFSSLFLLLICYFFSTYLENFLSIPKSWIYSALVVSFCTFLLNLRLGQWQVRRLAIKFGSLQIGNSLLNMLLSITFVVILNYGSQGRVYAYVIAIIIAALFAIGFLLKDKILKIFVWRLDYIKQILLFGVPLIPHVLGGFLLSSIDRFVINEKLGLSEAGFYMVAVQISMAFTIIFDAINKAFIPWLFEILISGNEKLKSKIVRYTYLYYIFLLLISILPFLIGSWLLLLIAGNEYKPAGEVIGWLCLGQIFGGMYLMVTNYIFYTKRTASLSLVTISSGILNVILLFVLVADFGIKGAAIAFAISKLVQFLLTWYLANKVIKMPWFTSILP